MNQEALIPAEDLTTQEVIAGCADAGLQVKVTQLTRWADYGLMSRPRKHGLGRGKGSEQRWAADCLPRAILIARALQDGDPSLLRAARALFDTGYEIKPELVPHLPRPKSEIVHQVRFQIDADVNDELKDIAARLGYSKKRLIDHVIHTWIDHYARTGEDLLDVLPQQIKE